jgi:hypothetical protein
VDNKGQSHKGAKLGDGESHRDEKQVTSFALRLAVQGMAPSSGSGDNLRLSEDDLGGAV